MTASENSAGHEVAETNRVSASVVGLCRTQEFGGVEFQLCEHVYVKMNIDASNCRMRTVQGQGLQIDIVAVLEAET